MLCQKVVLEETVAKYGTPLVVYSQSVLEENVEKLRHALPNSAQLAYSIKANPNPFILRTFRDLGLLVEAASEGEYTHALCCGFEPEKILLGGPGMSESTLRTAKGRGARALLLESINAIRRAKRLNIGDIPILLRVNPDRLQSRVGTRMTGVASPFGIDEAKLLGCVKEVVHLGLDYAGLFIYVGTQAEGAEAIAKNSHYLLEIDEHLSNCGVPRSRMLDFGGGFPTPESESEEPLDTEALRVKLSTQLLQRRSYDSELLFESGRFLVNNTSILITRVLDTKHSMGEYFAILDAGINVLGLRQLKYRSFTPIPYPLTEREGKQVPVTFVGPSCTPIDVVAEHIPTPPVREGDLVCLARFGAYSVSFSPTTFCGQGYPAEVAILTDGTIELTRKRARWAVGDYLDVP